MNEAFLNVHIFDNSSELQQAVTEIIDSLFFIFCELHPTKEGLPWHHHPAVAPPTLEKYKNQLRSCTSWPAACQSSGSRARCGLGYSVVPKIGARQQLKALDNTECSKAKNPAIITTVHFTSTIWNVAAKAPPSSFVRTAPQC